MHTTTLLLCWWLLLMQACRALLSLAQKNISFGKMLTNEHRAKTLVLNNISDVPLLYKLKKTGTHDLT
jgi:hypothetical protein